MGQHRGEQGNGSLRGREVGEEYKEIGEGGSGEGGEGGGGGWKKVLGCIVLVGVIDGASRFSQTGVR